MTPLLMIGLDQSLNNSYENRRIIEYTVNTCAVARGHHDAWSYRTVSVSYANTHIIRK